MANSLIYNNLSIKKTIADHDIADLVADVAAIFGGVPIPWPGMDTKACDKMDGEQCPLKKGQVAKWAYPVFVDPLYPKVSW